MGRYCVFKSKIDVLSKNIFVFNNDSLVKLSTLTKKSLIYRHGLQDKLISYMLQF